MDLDQITSSAKAKRFSFETKAETLYQLVGHLKSAQLLPMQFFNVSQWRQDKAGIMSDFEQQGWFTRPLIVRSSAQGEDGETSSMAGCFESVLNVSGREAFESAVETVIASYKKSSAQDQILIQPMLVDVICSGVAFSMDPNTGSPYFVINLDNVTQSTDSVTGGQRNHQTLYHYHSQDLPENSTHQKIITLIKELQGLFSLDAIDIEFAVDSKGDLFLFQVRPLIVKTQASVAKETLEQALSRIETMIIRHTKPHPYLYGKTTLFGNMPDWNPAEIVGTRPKPLALSLYKELVTDSVWAYQRNNYGYKNLRSFPLIINFEGIPYIDTRVSFNSFLPKDLPDVLSEKLVNFYLEKLNKNPELQDRVEFDIVFSCYALDLNSKLEAMQAQGFSADETQQLFESLKNLTVKIIHNRDGLWLSDLEKIKILRERQDKILNSDLDLVSKMYWLKEDCKRYGTLPFAGLARAAFIATQILGSLVSVGILNQTQYFQFLSNVNSVSSNMQRDFTMLSKPDFLSKYGHLRPGTYDLLSPSYDESPEAYFDWNQPAETIAPKTDTFTLSIDQLKGLQAWLDKDQIAITAVELLDFIKVAIESREYAKFIFTKSVSHILKGFSAFAYEQGFEDEQAVFADINVINTLYASSRCPKSMLKWSIEAGKQKHNLAKAIALPPVIRSLGDVRSFVLDESVPHFITQQSTTSEVLKVEDAQGEMKNKILLIPSADPGFDWIFSKQISGFITQYGGVNSHMAIRANELNIPAVIGVGEVTYQKLIQAKRIHLDCANKKLDCL